MAARYATPFCQRCPVSESCPMGALIDRDPQPGTVTTFGVGRSEQVIRPGELAGRVFMVRSGLLKTIRSNGERGEHVKGFQVAGDMLGIEALMRGQYTEYAQALEASEVCSMDAHELLSLAKEVPHVQRQLARRMGARLDDAEWRAYLLAHYRADERVAAFLAEMARRISGAQGDAHVLLARVSRKDMANYLGLTVETVSRVMTRLQGQGHVTWRPRRVLVDLQGLEGVAAGVYPGGAQPGPASSQAG